jgi:hypothetical protein
MDPRLREDDVLVVLVLVVAACRDGWKWLA